jgi:hypothetical protein
VFLLQIACSGCILHLFFSFLSLGFEPERGAHSDGVQDYSSLQQPRSHIARLSDNKMCLGQEININGVSISFRLLSFIKEYQCVARHFTPLLISAERACNARSLKQKLVCSRGA